MPEKVEKALEQEAYIKDEVARQMLDDTSGSQGRSHPTVINANVTTDSAGAFTYKLNNNTLTTAQCRAILPLLVGTGYRVANAFFNGAYEWRGYITDVQSGQHVANANFNVIFIAWLF